MNKVASMVGKVYGRLTVLSVAENDKFGNTFVICECVCGNKKRINSANLRHNKTNSCGCIHKENVSKKMKEIQYKHGLSNHNLMRCLAGMKNRCYNEKVENYKNYGGRGIKICDEWNQKKIGFINFYNWSINNGYKEGLTIDRINNDGNYEPSNCRWVTNEVQQRNKSNNIFLTFEGKTHCLAEWAEITGINVEKIGDRYRSNLPVERILFKGKLSRWDGHVSKRRVKKYEK